MNKCIECPLCMFRRDLWDENSKWYESCMVKPDSDIRLECIEPKPSCPYASQYQDMSDFNQAIQDTSWKWDMDMIKEKVRRNILETLDLNFEEKPK